MIADCGERFVGLWCCWRFFDPSRDRPSKKQRMPRNNNARTCKVDAGMVRGQLRSIRRNSFSLTRTGASTDLRAQKRTSPARGAACGRRIPHSHYKTATLVAGLSPSRPDGEQRLSMDRSDAALFEDWLETCLVPTLSPGEIVVMDNLPAHKGPRVEQLIKAAGAELRYLPAYSPDMNPIEKAFSKLKAFLRKIAERAVAGLMRALETCAEIFKPSQCTNYFKSCGYEHDTGWFRMLAQGIGALCRRPSWLMPI